MMTRPAISRAVLLVMVPAALIAWASVGAASGDGVSHADRAGMQAVQFSVKDLLELSSFQGTLISYQRFLTDTRALRVAAGLALDFNDRSTDVEFAGIDAAASADLTDWDHEGTVKIQLLFYRGEDSVLLYYGGGPTVGYADYHYENIIYGVSGDDLDYRYYGQDGSEWLLGLQSVLGVQWTVNDHFALHGEYGLTARYRLTESTSSYFRSDNPDLEEWSESRTTSPELSSDGVLVGLSVYF
ncbi:MAG: hypothetical protein JXB46_10890 [Candidatus Eisenbacteria bacterium]|nr:hypothetical protein [Candidatus Eisenbacteria bacterium]